MKVRRLFVLAVEIVVIVLMVAVLLKSPKEENTFGVPYVAKNSEVQIIIPERYYYRQLSEEAKLIYNKIDENKEKFIKCENMHLFTKVFNYNFGSEDIINAFSAYNLDNPFSSLWLIDADCKVLSISLYGIFDLSVLPAKGKNSYSYFKDAKEIIDAMAETETAVMEFIETLSGTEEEKLRRIHDWLLEDSHYFQKGEHSHDIYGTIIQKESVCDGYAKAFSYISNKIGIPCIVVIGYATRDDVTEGENHAWNYVFINGEWRLVDVTWDMKTTIYLDQTYKEVNRKSEIYYKYFLVPIEKSDKSHIPSDLFAVPTP